MIYYKAGRWGILFALTCRGSEFPKAAAFALPCGIAAVILHYVFLDEGIAKTIGVANLTAPALTGFYAVLGFLIVFRSQKAYSRWWEGGTLLQQMRGEWFNAFSSCLAFCNTDPERAQDVEKFQNVFVRLMSLLYGAALTDVSEMSDKTMEFFDSAALSAESLEFLQAAPVKSEIVLQWIQRVIHEASECGVVKVAPPILSRVYNQLGNGIVMLNNAQKLNEFPIPFTIAQMILFMLGVHWILTAMICATTVSTPFWAFSEAFVVTFIYWSVHYISEELERPFGEDPNDLPIIEMQADMNVSLFHLMSTEARCPPHFTFDPVQHKGLKRELFSLETDLIGMGERTPLISPLVDPEEVRRQSQAPAVPGRLSRLSSITKRRGAAASCSSQGPVRLSTRSSGIEPVSVGHSASQIPGRLARLSTRSLGIEPVSVGHSASQIPGRLSRISSSLQGSNGQGAAPKPAADVVIYMSEDTCESQDREQICPSGSTQQAPVPLGAVAAPERNSGERPASGRPERESERGRKQSLSWSLAGSCFSVQSTGGRVLTGHGCMG